MNCCCGESCTNFSSCVTSPLFLDSILNCVEGTSLHRVHFIILEQIHEIKDFILTAGRKDVLQYLKIKKIKDTVKFKVRCSCYLYSLVIQDKEKADKLKQSLRPGLAVKESAVKELLHELK